jgi:hypothetical protein
MELLAGTVRRELCEHISMIYCSAYFHVFAVTLILCTMAGGKCAREGNSEPSHKRTTVDLELKLRMIRKYEGAQSLPAIA